MPLSLGPNTVNDSIVFNYDIGDVANSYKGEPTTNLISDPDGNANIITTDVPFGTNVVGYAQYNSGYYVNPRSTTNTSATGNTFTYSVYMRSQSTPASTYLMYVYTGTGPDGGWYYFGDGSLTSDWKRYTYTRSDMTGTVSTVTVYRYNQQGTIDIAAPQIEINSHATQFVKGTRSTTQGLLDISGGSNTITLATSYDNNAQPYFDATDDFISLGSDVTFKTTGGWTVESIVYYNSVAGNYNNTTSPANFIGAEAIDYNSWYWSVLENKLALWNISPGVWKYGSTTLQSNTWYYVTLVSFAGGLTYQFYLNGVAEGGDHTTYSWNPSYSGLKIRYIGKGNNANTRLVNGRINMTKVYDRALTSTEIANNYRQYKTRFNLS